MKTKIKEVFMYIISLGFVILIAALSINQCSKSLDSRYYNQDDIEDAVDDSKWDIPSRYRD